VKYSSCSRTPFAAETCVRRSSAYFAGSGYAVPQALLRRMEMLDETSVLRVVQRELLLREESRELVVWERHRRPRLKTPRGRPAGLRTRGPIPSAGPPHRRRERRRPSPKRAENLPPRERRHGVASSVVVRSHGKANVTPAVPPQSSAALLRPCRTAMSKESSWNGAGCRDAPDRADERAVVRATPAHALAVDLRDGPERADERALHDDAPDRARVAAAGLDQRTGVQMIGPPEGPVGHDPDELGARAGPDRGASGAALRARTPARRRSRPAGRRRARPT
jgi:hypothetical protein